MPCAVRQGHRVSEDDGKPASQGDASSEDTHPDDEDPETECDSDGESIRSLQAFVGCRNQWEGGHRCRCDACLNGNQ